MLFDLRGRRRRAVQATYLLLALLMGGGLVFFGIGGDVSGGLFDAFSERGGGGSGSDVVQDRIERNEKRLESQPRNEAALKALVRDYQAQAAAESTESTGGQFSEDSKDELREAAKYWQRYLAIEDARPDSSLAAVALRVYDVGALNRPKEAQRAATILADAQNNYQSYLQLVSYATLAGDKRTADLATLRAIDLAPKGDREQVRRTAKQLKTAAEQQQASG
jgi:hypothetical protein